MIAPASDMRMVPAYGFTEVAHALEMPARTLQAWTRGTQYTRPDGSKARFEPVITLDGDGSAMSYFNLIEAHVLRGIRSTKGGVKGVALPKVREAIRVAEQYYHIDRLLVHEQLRWNANLFLDRFFDIVELSRSHQVGMRAVLDDFLARIDYEDSLPIRFFPFVANAPGKPIEISAFRSFGKATIAGRGVSTVVIARRIDAGESMEELSEDYALTEDEIVAAIRYEAAA